MAGDFTCGADGRRRIQYGRLACFFVLGETCSREGKANRSVQKRATGFILLRPVGRLPNQILKKIPSIWRAGFDGSTCEHFIEEFRSARGIASWLIISSTEAGRYRFTILCASSRSRAGYVARSRMVPSGAAWVVGCSNLYAPKQGGSSWMQG